MSILDKSPVLMPCRDDPAGEHNFTGQLDLKSKKKTSKLIDLGWKRCQNCGMLANYKTVKKQMKKRKKRRDDDEE